LNAYLITGKSGLKSTKPIAHKLAKIDPKIYDEYIGRYKINHEAIVTVSRQGDKLMAQPSGDAQFELFPESETVFFLKPTTDATATFVKDSNGKISHIVLTRDGRKTTAKRLDGEPQPSAATTGTLGTNSLFDTIRDLDMQLFGAFNALDADGLDKFFTEDVEFYHDQGGLTRSREALVQTFRKKFSEKDSKLRRELIEGSLEVYPLSTYGAIETGKHRFFQTAGGQNEREATVSRFIHLWQKTDSGWKISRALSYDHKGVN
jgi:ketosteroid isomerase-like protein